VNQAKIAGVWPWKAGFNSMSFHVAFMVDKVALGCVSPHVIRVFSVSSIQSMFHTHPSITDAV
jgi:hypothetical protein